METPHEWTPPRRNSLALALLVSFLFVFLELLKADEDVKKALTDADLEALFDMSYHTKQVETIFRRVFGQ